MEIPFLKDIALIFGLCVGVLWVCSKVGIPTIVAFLLTGILSGPHGLGVIHKLEDVKTFSEIGIMLLLFTIGLEFSLKKLYEIKHYFFIGGFLQVLITILIGILVAQIVQRPLGESIFLGFLLSLSSTAIVLKSLDDKGETDSPHGRLSLGILIFQDIIAVPMMIITPALSEVQHSVDAFFFYRVFIGIIVVCIVFLAAIKIVPTLLYYIAKTRNRELFSLSVLMLCLAVAWLSAYSGLSLAIGAFLAGLLISESEYRHEAIGHILPLQDVFASLFFISIGMLLDINFVLQQPLLIFVITCGIIVMKGIVVAFTGLCLGLPFRVMILAGLALSQIGEFSFVLAKAGIEFGIGENFNYQLFLAVALFTMALTPSIIKYSNIIVDLFFLLPLPEKIKTGLQYKFAKKEPLYKNHLLIIGYGMAGKNVAYAAKSSHLSYLILEMNPVTVRKEKEKGEPIHFGDASHESVLKHMDIAHAKAIAVMINDPKAAQRVVALSRKLNPKAYIIVRTKFVQEVSVMLQLGANEVIPDEFGSSLEILSRILDIYQIPSSTSNLISTELRLNAN